MAYERHWEEVAPRLLTSNGNSAGYFSVADLTGFYVKQSIVFKSNTQVEKELQIKRIDVNAGLIYVGTRDTNINKFEDISAFTLADSAFVFAAKQEKSSVTPLDQEKATYETEPIVAKRVILVDDKGRKISEANPLPVDATVSVVVPPVTVDLDAFSATPDNVMTVGSIDGTKTGEKYGWVNNIKQQIMASHDRKRDAFYLDISSKKDRRLDKFEYTSPTFPGVTLVRQFSWTLVGTEYVYENDEWSVI